MDDLAPKSEPGYTGVPIGAEMLPVVPETKVEPQQEFTGKVLLSPTDTRGWKGFTVYVGSDPDSDVPGIRVDGWTDSEGVQWVRASGSETAAIKVVFENSPYLPPVYLVRYDASDRVRLSARRVRRQRSEQEKRGL